ncbi:ABC transporter substrate-binding protein [Corynebacterium kalidii]|uniref:Iron-siderophore ABC transporter substrate-binding protein n=1 Tax=Corynebacterium kalidii TaxID=2931982 RepID=A0A9X1WKA7_9CORY|nr:iron-siderophore ABC transporter substrate-binding protein [Corynebacterium kalidii]MCJ7859117.1 iron-siderophore ABC transporter substrate-binding protein [Corynebacterium kalidii]
MKILRAVGAILVPAVAVGLSLGSCSSDTGDDTGASGASGTSGSSDPAATSQAFPVTVEHHRGSTEIPEAPQRIVALDNAFLDYAVDLGGTVVGVSDIGADLVPGYLDADQAARAAGVESVGSIAEPQLEKIAALEPDLILSSEVRHGEYYDRLAEIAPTVFSEDTGDTWQENYLLTGEALGKKEQAQERLDALHDRAGRIGDRIRAKAGADTGADAGDDAGADLPDTSIVRIRDANTIRLYGEDTFSGSVLAMVGLPRPANQESGYPGQDYGMYVVSQENLDQAEADLLLVAVPEEGSEKAGEWAEISDAVLGSSTWTSFDGRKVDVDEGTWMTSVSPLGADHILTDVAEIFDVDGE